MKKVFFFYLAFLIITSCDKSEVIEPQQENVSVIVSNSTAFESGNSAKLSFEISIKKILEEDLRLEYIVEGVTAEPDVDFVKKEGNLIIPAGELLTNLEIDLLDDEINEVEERVQLVIAPADGISVLLGGGLGTILDDDDVEAVGEDGYSTSRAHYGYELKWEDEFDGDQLDASSFNYEYGNSGWGNNELQNYTDSPDNLFVKDGKLTIRAIQDGFTYTSARIQTKDKQEFKYGRIDVRAKLPKGQGIWPAIWMLGENIDEVSWPACGEIDIMELVGHQPKNVHGTAHWGYRGEPSTYNTKTYTQSEEFIENFHVFSIVWELNEISWYVDENKFHKLTINEVKDKPYPFNNDFFFIFNVAVGGNWPGYPDDSTVFPQEMVIDYIRVFQ